MEAYKSLAIELFKDVDFSQFGKLITFEYNGFIRPVVLNGLNKKYLWGYCLKRWVIDNDKCERLFNFEVIGNSGITDLSDGQHYTSRAFYEKYLPLYYPDRKFGYSFKDLYGKPQIYFTGFPAATKKEMESKALAAGMWVTSDMTENMAYLVCGPRAGQKKIEKARTMDTVLLTADGFETLLQTGEILRIE
ncbi:BRCT domain-containing protein [Neisseria sp. S1]|uniref:BRCT domain-containing protein n=1 Tax=Neisseria sp. S1 TaxID=3318354 RepID=UPI003A84351D